jgi:hypothetical protein
MASRYHQIRLQRIYETLWEKANYEIPLLTFANTMYKVERFMLRIAHPRSPVCCSLIFFYQVISRALLPDFLNKILR